MRLAIIDTSTQRSLVALTEGVNLLCCEELAFGLRNSHFVTTALHDSLKKLNYTIQDLDAIAVTQGPGSFTGVRVGAALAKGLAFGASLPLIGISSLAGFVSEKDGIFASVIDARIKGAYVLIQERNQHGITNHSSPQLCPLEELQDYTKECKVIVGPSLERLPFDRKKIHERAPDPCHMAAVALELYHKGAFSTQAEVDLLYLHSVVNTK